MHKCGVDLNTVDYNGMTVGHVAVRKKNLEIIKFLREKTHFDFSIEDNDGVTVLHEAEKRGLQEICDYLSTY